MEHVDLCYESGVHCCIAILLVKNFYRRKYRGEKISKFFHVSYDFCTTDIPKTLTVENAQKKMNKFFHAIFVHIPINCHHFRSFRLP